jgi:hypothetical protein
VDTFEILRDLPVGLGRWQLSASTKLWPAMEHIGTETGATTLRFFGRVDQNRLPATAKLSIVRSGAEYPAWPLS